MSQGSDVKVGDDGYIYFSTGYGPPRYELFVVKKVQKRRIFIQTSDHHELTECKWRKTRFVPMGKTTKESRCYSICFGPIPQDLIEAERGVPH